MGHELLPRFVCSQELAQPSFVDVIKVPGFSAANDGTGRSFHVSLPVTVEHISQCAGLESLLYFKICH